VLVRLVGDGIQAAGDDMSRPYVVKRAPSSPWYFGVGAAGLTDVATLQSTTSTDPYRITTLSPNSQKCHWVYPASWGAIGVTLSGFDVGLMLARYVEIDGVSYVWRETVALSTHPNSRLVVGAQS
jgi:hypothetical protein